MRGLAASRPSARQPNSGLALTVFVVDILCQIALMVLGFYIVLGDVFAIRGRPRQHHRVPVTWCIFGTLYGLGAIAATFISSRRAPQPLGTLPADRPLQRFVYRVEHSPIARFITTISTFIVSIKVGLTDAVELLVLRNNPDWGFLTKAVAIWTMLLSWALFHWGYARLYARTYRMASDPKPLSFPGNEEPGLADFVYFAFTTASAFSASDVSVMTRRCGGRSSGHSTLSFFNALIVVLAVNTLIQA